MLHNPRYPESDAAISQSLAMSSGDDDGVPIDVIAADENGPPATPDTPIDAEEFWRRLGL